MYYIDTKTKLKSDSLFVILMGNKNDLKIEFTNDIIIHL